MPSDVVLLDDDSFFGDAFQNVVADLGLNCRVHCSVCDILPVLRRRAPQFCVVDLAVPLGGATGFSDIETKAGHWSGPAVIRRARAGKWSQTRFAIITGRPSAEIREWCAENDVVYLIKPMERCQLEYLFGLRPRRAFVVHGRDANALKKAKKALENIGVEPIVLMEQPDQGRTVIEKFEEVAAVCDCAIVLATPDDVGGLRKGRTRASRIRQNVLFELGYFCGHFGRTTGRVLYIEIGDTEVPSDLAGLVRIDGTVSAAKFEKKLSVELR